MGKTTLVGAVSEIRPLRTEEVLTDRGIGVDDVAGVEGKTTTTVAMDFGRITIRDGLVALPVRHPGPGPVLVHVGRAGLGALGAVVLADTRRLADCFPSVDYFEQRGTPFIVAVNCFDGADGTKPTRCGSPSTWTRTCRCCCATYGAATRPRPCWSRSWSTP